jgi:hypothetical protein
MGRLIGIACCDWKRVPMQTPALAEITTSAGVVCEIIIDGFVTAGNPPRIETVPNNFVADWFGFEIREFFQKSSNDAANVPLVNLGSVA